MIGHMGEKIENFHHLWEYFEAKLLIALMNDNLKVRSIMFGQCGILRKKLKVLWI